jgi:hypothetical protein
MQPRKFLDPDLDTAFHVTKSGWDSGMGRLLTLELWLVPLGVELMLEEVVVVGDGARRPDIAAGLLGGSTGSRASVVRGSALYFVHRASTWGRERLSRFSRLAARVSKQYAQWAWVAISNSRFEWIEGEYLRIGGEE